MRPQRVRITKNDEDITHGDLTKVPNENPEEPTIVEYEIMCDLGHWHRKASIPLPPTPANVIPFDGGTHAT